MIAKVERSFLVRQVQVWEIEMPDGTDMDHVLGQHFTEFDESLCADGTLVEERPEFLDDDELEVRLLEGHTARIIHLHKRRRR